MNRKQLVSTNATNWSPAMQAVAADTIRRKGGSASKQLIVSEIDRRLVDTDLGDLLANGYSPNQYAELSAVMGSNNTLGYGAIECSVIGWGIWSFAKHGYETADAHLSESYAFGFDSIEEFIEVVDLYSAPLDVPAKPEPTPPKEDPYAPIKKAAKASAKIEVAKTRAKVRAAKEEAKHNKFIEQFNSIINRLSEILTGI